MEVLVYHCRFCSHLNGTKDENIARKCRCYFCTEIRKATGVELEGQASGPTTPRKVSDPGAKAVDRISDEERHVEAEGRVEGIFAEALRQRRTEAVAGGEVGSALKDDKGKRPKGAIEEGWEELKSRTD